MKNRLLTVCLMLLMCLSLYGEGGSITGVVVGSRHDSSGNDTVLVEVKGEDDSECDEIIIKLPKKTVKNALAGHLPPSWNMSTVKNRLILKGSAVKCPVNIRIDLSKGNAPVKADIEVLKGGKSIYKAKSIAIKRFPRIKISDDLSSVIKLPPLVSPGGTIEFKPLDEKKTPVTGTWNISGIDSYWLEDKGMYSLTLPYKLNYDMDVPVTYTDSYGVDLYSTLKYPEIRFIEVPSDTAARITGVSPMVFTNGLICICGYFPDDNSKAGIMLDGRPLTNPVSTSDHVMIFRLNSDVTPGTHQISGMGSEGFDGSSSADFEVIQIRGQIDRNKLMSGESTPLKLWIEGTEKALTVKLTNKTPQIVTLDGGNEQELVTSGGKINSIEKTVHAGAPGDFRIIYNINLSFCPCYEATMEEAEEEQYFENMYDDAVNDLRSGRSCSNDAADLSYDNLEEAKLKAREALRLFTRAREKIQQGRENGDIGPETARTMIKIIEGYESQASKVLEMEEEEELPVASTPDPASSRPEEKPVAVVTDGWFQPVQAVWQDDDVFKDFEGKQLSKAGPGQWNAELKMVVNKRTLIFGIREDQRNRVKIMGTTNGTKLVKVKFRFKLIQGSSQKILYTERTANNYVALDGPVGPEIPFAASLMVSRGIPEYRAFTIDSAGGYTLECELLRESGEETGLKVIVNGQAINTFGPDVKIVPVKLSNATGSYGAGYLPGKAQVLATRCEKEIPVFYPLADGGMSVTADPTVDLTANEPGTVSKLVSLLPFTDTTENIRADALAASMAQRFGTGASLTNGPKVYVLLSDHDFDLTRRGGRAAAYCASQKLMVGRHDNRYTTVAHELVHSMPYLWSVSQMQSNFGMNYHNDADNNNGKGVLIDRYFRLKKNTHAIMGSDYSSKWISQGTYWHLLNEFRSKPDPELFIARGYIARDNGKSAGYFAPFYTTMGVADLEPATPQFKGNWKMVSKGNDGKVIAEYPVPAKWHVPDLDVERKILPVTYRIPLKNVASVELHGPDGLIDTRKVTPNPPLVKIVSSGTNDKLRLVKGRMVVKWKGSDKDKDKLRYSVLYSPDNGKKWRILAMDIDRQSYLYKLPGNPKKIKFRIVATDGMRSGTDEITYTLRDSP